MSAIFKAVTLTPSVFASIITGVFKNHFILASEVTNLSAAKIEISNLSPDTLSVIKSSVFNTSSFEKSSFKSNLKEFNVFLKDFNFESTNSEKLI